MKALTGTLLAVGTPENTPDILYATGFSSPDQVGYLQRGRKKYLIVPSLERQRAERVTEGTKVYSPEDFRSSSRGRVTWLSAVQQLLAQTRTRIVTVARDFPIGLARELEKSGFHIRVAGQTLFPGREVKRADEARKIRECQIAAIGAMRVAIRMIKGSRVNEKGYLHLGGSVLTSEMIRRAIEMELLRHDCTGPGTIVSCGRQSVEPHERGTGPLSAGAAIVIDIFPRSKVHGYWGDLTRTIVKGKAPPALKAMFQAVKAAQEAALSRIKAGVSCSTIHKAAAASLSRSGFATGMKDGKLQGFIHSTGHGVGLAVHEPPSLAPGAGRLKAGQVISVEPGLYYRQLGGVRIEDLVVVTKKGWRYIASCGKMFMV